MENWSKEIWSNLSLKIEVRQENFFSCTSDPSAFRCKEEKQWFFNKTLQHEQREFYSVPDGRNQSVVIVVMAQHEFWNQDDSELETFGTSPIDQASNAQNKIIIQYKSKTLYWDFERRIQVICLGEAREW